MTTLDGEPIDRRLLPCNVKEPFEHDRNAMHREHLLEGPAPSRHIEKKRRFVFNHRLTSDRNSNHQISPRNGDKIDHCHSSFTLFIGTEDLLSQYAAVKLCPLGIRQVAVNSRIQKILFDLGLIENACASFSVIRDKIVD